MVSYVDGDVSTSTASVSSVAGLNWVSHNAADIAIVGWALFNTATPTLDAALTSSSNVVDTNVRGIIGTKATAGSESGAISLTCDVPNANRMCGALALYRACTLGQIVSLGEASGTAQTSHTSPTITPANGASGYVLVFVERVASTVAPAGTPAGFTKRQEFSTGGTGGTSVVIYDDLSGTHGTSPWTPANVVSLTASTSAIVFLIELPPAAVNVTLGLALETDAAQALASSKLATLAVATETDAAVAVSTSKAVTLGLSAETDIALALAVSKAVTLGRATEADTALPLAPAKTITLAVASETDAALPLVASRGAATLAVATETDSAPALGLSKLITLGVATETDLAPPFSISSIVGTVLGVATEADAARNLTLSKQVVLGVATEADTAVPLAGSKALGLATAAEIDAAFALITGSAPVFPGHLIASVSQSLTAAATFSVLTASTEPTSRLEASDGV